MLETVRVMEPEDLPQVMQIERACYRYPWTEQIFRDCMRVGYLCLVLEQTIDNNDTLAGFAIVSHAAGEAHILNVCIDPDKRRQGRAQALIGQAVASVLVQGAQILFLEVRPSNDAALALYRQLGFVEIGRRANYYTAEGGREDAIVMSLQINESIE